MEKSVYKKYLFEYYKAKQHSFLLNMNKAVTMSSAGSIHQLRVDVKRMKAVFHLLELLFPKRVIAKKYVRILRPVFKSAGKIREGQVNSQLVAKYPLPSDTVKAYRQFLKKREKEYKVRFKNAIEHFHTDKLSSSKIKKHCVKVKDKQIIDKSQSFINDELLTVKQISEKRSNAGNIHKIRMHLKSLHAIMALLNKIRTDKGVKKLLTLMKQCEDSIGEWHDRVGLINSLEDFQKDEKQRVNLIKPVQNTIKKENRLLLKKIKDELKPIIGFPLQF